MVLKIVTGSFNYPRDGTNSSLQEGKLCAIHTMFKLLLETLKSSTRTRNRRHVRSARRRNSGFRLQWGDPKVGEEMKISIITGICVAHRCKTQAFSCKSYTLQLSSLVTTCSTVYRDPKAAQGTSKTDHGGQMGGSPKAPPSASGRGNQPAGGDTESNRGCPSPVSQPARASVRPTLSTSNRVWFCLNQSPDHTGVTVATAPKS